MKIQTSDLWSFLKEYKWMLVFGTLIGITVTIDPYLYYKYFPEEAKLGFIEKLWRYPFSLPILIVIVPILLRFLYQKAKTITRLQWDHILFFLFISTMFINYWVWIHVHVTFMIVGTGIFIFLMRSALAGRFDIVILPIDIFYIILMMFMMLSSYAILGSSRVILGNVIQFFTGMFLPVLFIHNVIRTRRQLVKAIHYIVYLTLFSSALGIIQYLAFKFFGIDITNNWNVKFDRIVTLPIFGSFSRVAGLSGNCNYLGFSTGTITALMTYLLVKPHCYLSRNWKRIFFVGVILGLFTSLFTASRGSWLAMAVCYVVIPFMAYPKYSRHFLLALLLICVVGFGTGFFEYVYDSMHGMRVGAISIRERLMRLGIDAIINYPLTGVGFGYFVDYWNFDDDEVHNMWLNFCSQIGIPGMLVLVSYFFSIIYRLIRAIKRTSGFDRLILESFFVSLIFFVVNSTVRPMIWDKFFWIYFGFIEAAIYVFTRVRGKVKVYYPIFGYSWKEEPSVQLDRR
jgi:hypothetical protein